MLEDITRVTSFSHQKLPSQVCEVLAFAQFWSWWCIYIFLLEIIIYLLVLVFIQNKDHLVIVAKLKRSKRSRLEVVITLASLVFPMVILWYPFYDDIYHYGLNDYMCALTAPNHSDIPRSSDIMSELAIHMPPALAGLTIILSVIGMIILYCSLSSKLQSHRLARNVIKKLFTSLVVVIIFSCSWCSYTHTLGYRRKWKDKFHGYTEHSIVHQHRWKSSASNWIFTNISFFKCLQSSEKTSY